MADRNAAIYARYLAGASTQAAIATEFGLSPASIGLIIRRQKWRANPDGPEPDETAPRARQYAERREYINALKMKRGCIDCGYNKHSAALEFDHREGETKAFATFSSNLCRAWSVILAEIEKCDVRCANCHAIVTAERGYKGGRPKSTTP